MELMRFVVFLVLLISIQLLRREYGNSLTAVEPGYSVSIVFDLSNLPSDHTELGKLFFVSNEMF